MTIRLKLAWNSTLIVLLVLSFTFVGSYLLFMQHVRADFYKHLQNQAFTAAFFHLEKDELNNEKYRLIEKQYQAIHQESLRFFNEDNKMVFEQDSLNYAIPAAILERVREQKVLSFELGKRQFSGIYYQDNEGNFVILASGIDHDGLHQLSQLRLYLSGFLLTGILLSFLLTRWLAKQTFKPFSELIHDVNTISANNLDERLSISAHQQDELSELAQAFNLFLERLENGIKSQQHFLKHASHELKTPLAAIIGNLEVTLSKDRNAAEYREKMSSIYADALHIKAILEGLLVLSGLEASQENIVLNTLRLDELLWDILEKNPNKYELADIRIDLEDVQHTPHLLEVEANKELLMIAIGNLLDNALKFSNDQPVFLKLGQTEGKLTLSIRDKGIGIDEKDIASVFTLFFRGANSQSIGGHGIGLHLSKLIFDIHHITVHIDSVVGKGTVIQLVFPNVLTNRAE